MFFVEDGPEPRAEFTGRSKLNERLPPLRLSVNSSRSGSLWTTATQIRTAPRSSRPAPSPIRHPPIPPPSAGLLSLGNNNEWCVFPQAALCGLSPFILLCLMLGQLCMRSPDDAARRLKTHVTERAVSPAT